VNAVKEGFSNFLNRDFFLKQSTLAQEPDSSDDDHDAYAERMKAEGKGKDED